MAATLLSGATFNYQSKVDPIHGAIWQALNHYQYDDALIMAERLYADNPGQDEVFLLSTCHYRMGNKWACKEILEDIGPTSSNNKFLYARVLVDLKEEHRALTELSGACLTLTNNGEYSRNVSSFVYEFGDSAAFSLILAAEIHQTKGQTDRAAECFKMSLKHNPFLFTPYQKLCHIGKGSDPDQILDVSSHHQFFDMKDCIAPYKESNISFDSNLKGDIPMRKQSKQALQTVTNNTIAPPTIPTNTIEPSPNSIQRTSSTPAFSFKHQGTLDHDMDMSPILKSNNPTPNNKNSRSMIALLQNQNDEMRKHMERMENGFVVRKKKTGARRDGLRSERDCIREGGGRRLFGSPNLIRTSTLRSENISGNVMLKENSETLSNRRRITRSSVSTTTRGGVAVPLHAKLDSDDDDISSRLDNKLSSKVLKKKEELKKQRNKEEALQKKSLSVLVGYYRIMGRAYLARSEHRFSDARAHLNELPTNQRETGWVLNELARCYFDDHKFQDALDIYKRIQQLEPHRLIGLEYYSTCLWRLEDSITLSALANRFMERARHRPETWCIMGNLFSIKQEHERAQNYFSRAVEICESDFNIGYQTECRHYAYLLLGHELVLQNEFESAVQCFRNALKVRPRLINALLGIGEVYMKEEYFKNASQVYQIALKYVPKSPTVWSNVGRAYYELANHQMALKCFEKALSLNPKFPHALYYRANVYYALENYHMALEELKKMDKTNPKEAMVNYMLGKVYHRLGQTNLSNVHMSYATELDPKGTAKQKENSDSINKSSDATGSDQVGGDTWDTTTETQVSGSSRTHTLVETSTMELIGDQSTSLQNLEELLTTDDEV